MAAVEATALSKSDHDELCCSYAALMLHDDGVEITAEKLTKVIKASGNTVEPYWPMLFVKALKGANIGDMLTNVAAAPAAAGPAGAGPAAAAEAPKEEEKKEEEEDVDMGGLFGDEDDY
jgi:large subunit ribosomal protein LP1